MTTSITLRSTKGSALTHDEMDTNLTNLQTTADDALAATDTLTSDKAEAAALGVANTDQNMGSFTGSTISDNVSAKAAIQALETAVETKANATAVGVTSSAANMGTYTGTTIPDNETAKQNLQSLETAVETKANASALGVTASAANMGTYTGSTITDNQTAKQNIQELETAAELRLPRFADRTALAAVSTTLAAVYDVAYLWESGREGTFVWSAANNATNVTNDPGQAFYVPPSSDTTGATGAWVRKFSGSASPKWFGAVGDGTTDDTTPVTRSITGSAYFSVPLDGGLALYAVSGDLQFSAVSNIDIRMLRLKQLTPNDVNRKTLYFLNCEELKLEYVEVDRNGAGTQGGLNTAAGIWINGGSDHRCRNLEAYGNGKGSGVVIQSTIDGIYENYWGHDIAYDDTAATDDQVQGIWCYLNTRCSFVNFKATDLTGNATGQPANRYTRGIAAGGNVDCKWLTPDINEVDQGIDVSGSDGNRDCQIIGGSVKNCDTWGVKLANSAVRVTVIGVHAENCGLSGFVASGPSTSGLTYKTMDCRFIGCTMRNCGNGSVAGTKAGAQIQTSAFDTDFPKGIKFIDCFAEDDQGTPTMEYGFRNEVTYDGTSGKLNEIVNCRSIGHTTGLSTGFHYYSCKVKGTSTQSINDATATNLDWDAEVFDGAAMHSTVSNTSNINFTIDGRYDISFSIAFASNATGYRRIRALLSGGLIQGGDIISAAVNGAETIISGTVEVIATTANTARLEATQNSGGALNVNLANSHFTATLIEAL